MLEVPGAAEVILRAGSADGWELTVAVQEELHFALAPPARVVHLPGQIGADVLSATFHTIEQSVYAAIERVAAPPLRMKIGGILGHIRQCVGNLVVIPIARLVPGVLQRN